MIVVLLRHVAMAVHMALSLLVATILSVGGTRVTLKFGRHFWAPVSCWLLGVKVSTQGRIVPPPGGRGCVVTSNHQGYMDIIVLLMVMGEGDFRFMAKASLFKIPLLGWYLRAAGFIPIHRSQPERAVRGLQGVTSHLAEGRYSVVGFPEGTRSPDGNLLPFKKGPFVLAINSGAPVIPVVISGSHDVLPRQRLLVRPGQVMVKVLPPVFTSGLGYEDRDELASGVRSSIISELEELRNGTPGEAVLPEDDSLSTSPLADD